MVKHILTFSDIILYWELEDCKDTNREFYTYLNGELKSRSNKTHVTVKGVEGERACIEIYNGDGKEKLFFKSEFPMPRKPKFIDISRPPYSAIPDGKTLNTAAIQRAIDDCGEGECVYIPEGTYLTGSLKLHSNMQIYVEKNGTLLGSQNPADYLPKIISRFEGLEAECYSPLISIGNIDDRDSIVCENIMIYGEGKIEGGGRPLAERVIELERERLKDYMESLGDEISTYENADTIPGRLRPKLFNICCSRNIVMAGVDLGNGACWNVHMIYSRDIVTCNCTIFSQKVWNGDGWNPDSSTDCTIFNCDFNTGDDCIAIKSGKNPEGNIINKPTKNIRIFDCRCIDGHAIAVGSEMSGGVSDIYIWDCDMRNTVYGFQIKGTKKRGGYVKNIYVSNFTASRISMSAVSYNDDGIGAPTVPVFSDIHFENLTLTGISREEKMNELKNVDAIELIGFDEEHPIKNLTLSNITLDSKNFSDKQSFLLSHLKNIRISNLKVK